MPPLMETLNALPLPQFLSTYLSTVPPSLPTSSAPHSPAQNHTLALHTPTTIPLPLLSACLSLLTHTSAPDYAASSLGWSASKKRREMRLPDLKYLILTPPHNPSHAISAFLSFMPTYEDAHSVLYVYELHVAAELRGQGVGTRLMEIVEEAAGRMGVEKVMLTVFSRNEGARKFYGGRGYGVDPYSPEVRRLRDGRVKGGDYVILSKGVEVGEKG